MSLIEHTRRELELCDLFDKDSDYNGDIGKSVMELIECFSKQGHSGCSANMVLNIFNKLGRYKTLKPLTGDDGEWDNIEGINGNTYQNIRNYAVFKEGKNGKPYYIDAYVKKTQKNTFWNGSLHLKDGSTVGLCYIKDFSNMPTIVIDVIEEEIEKGNWNTWIKDETQLLELAKYYDFEISKK